jgi:hypothetical protein
MASMLLLNPRRRKRRASSHRKHHKHHRRHRMTAKQLKYFGPRAHRKHHRKHRRSVVVVHANPHRRHHRRKHHAAHHRHHRRYRRNPIALPGGMRASLSSIQKVAMNAAVGGAGAVLTDIVLGYVLKLLPASKGDGSQLIDQLGSRYSASGGPNWMYYAAKVPLAIALGVTGSMFLPGKMKGYAAQGAEGALTVAAYEILRLTMPASITMGYYSSAAVVSGGVSQSRLAAYTARKLAGLGTSASGSGSLNPPSFTGRDIRVGEGNIS